MIPVLFEVVALKLGHPATERGKACLFGGNTIAPIDKKPVRQNPNKHPANAPCLMTNNK